jgi:polynucleotide 5'-hydroxyl-kinase GRC3/NOL9
LNILPLSAIDLPPGWEAAATAALAADGVTLVLGGPDCGKSTFCRYVLGLAQAAQKPIAFIDGDLGQSHLGPPATLGLNLYPPHHPDDAGLHPDGLYFIGQTSPPGKLLELVVGLRRLIGAAHSRGCRRIIVNTSGFIGGPAALRLKMAKVEVLAPHLCLGLQRDRELEPILTPLRQCCPQMLILPVSEQARTRLFTERRLYRQERFAAYFAGASARQLALDQVVWLGFSFGQGESWPEGRKQRLGQLLETEVLHAEMTVDGRLLIIGGRSLAASAISLACREIEEKKISFVNWGNLELRLVGLLDHNLMAQGLGLLLPSDWERRQIFIHTPLSSHALDRVKFCRLGKIRLDFDGQELPL